MPVKISQKLLIPTMAFLAACGGGGGAGDTSPPPGVTAADTLKTTMPSDIQIARLVYDTNYSVPSGFFVDERAGTDRSYTVHHVMDTSSSFELCTDDYAVALAWEEADNASRSVQGYYVESYDNARYFEFVRELAYTNDVGNIEDVTSPGFARVFKCSNTSRDGVDRSLLTGYAGMLNARPLDQRAVREFAEYFWQFAFFPTSRKKVIESNSLASNAALQQTLVLAFAINQGAGRCDRIDVAEWRFSADRVSGEVSQSFDTIANFEASSENGTVTICD